MEEENRLGVEEDGVDVLVGAGGGLGGGGHFEWPEEAGDEYFQLFHVLLLRLHHAEYEAEQDRDQFSPETERLYSSVAQPEIKIYSQPATSYTREARLNRDSLHSPVPLSHTLSVGGFYVIFHNLFPSSPGIIFPGSYYFIQ